jgi:preprotein translocase subunit YajC
MSTKFNIGDSVQGKGGLQGTVILANESPASSVRVKLPDGKEQNFAAEELEKINPQKANPVAWSSTERSGKSGI